MTKRVYNFSAGPAVLPLPVLERAQRDLVALPGVGASVLEISHRSKHFEAILAEAKSLLRELLSVPENYSILFLQGGSNLQFSMVPMNLLGAGQSADYIVTGTWGGKAAQDAQREGEVVLAWDGKSHNYSRLPTEHELQLTSDAAYVHITSNETIQGVQFSNPPEVGTVPLVCDASSDFLSRPVEVWRYGLIYACAQKNAGISGVTVVLIRDDVLEQTSANLPPMLDYKLHAKNDSMYNTPPTFAIYMLMLVGRWLRDDIGGLAKMHELNQAKARLLYDTIDQSGGFYKPHAQSDCRSLMNVTFRLPSEELETAFVREAQARDIFDIKGHRSVGGIRASIYNAMPRQGVEALRDFMVEFQKKSAKK